MQSDLLFEKDEILSLGLGDSKSKKFLQIHSPRIESVSSMVVLETIQTNESFQLHLILIFWA